MQYSGKTGRGHRRVKNGKIFRGARNSKGEMENPAGARERIKWENHHGRTDEKWYIPM